jgi:hypothetical protein
MDDARSNIDDKDEIVSGPRQNIFGSSLTSRRSACLHSRMSKARTIHVRKSCIHIPGRKRSKPDLKIENLEIEDEIQEVNVKDDDCFYSRSNNGNQSELAEQDEIHEEDNERENSTTNRRHSCSYQRKG